jgi:hypothetical protein
MQVPVPADNAEPQDLIPEPEGFWDLVREQVAALTKGVSDD